MTDEQFAQIKLRDNNQSYESLEAKLVGQDRHALIVELARAIARAEKAEAALGSVYEWLREPDWAGDGWSINDWLSRRPITVLTLASLTEGDGA